MARIWILTGLPENHEATRDHGFTVSGLNWALAFQGQVRQVFDHDARVLMDRMSASAGARA